MYQLVAIKASCAPSMIIVKFADPVLSGREQRIPVCLYLYCLFRIYRCRWNPCNVCLNSRSGRFMDTQVIPIRRTVIKVMRHCRDSFFIFCPPPLHSPRRCGCESDHIRGRRAVCAELKYAPVSSC